MAINVKFSKFDNTPWGFRLAGGSDFPQPLTVIKVIEGSLAECMGLRVGDVVVRLNDQPVGSLTHGQAHEALLLAGNNFVLGVQREEEALKALEALSEENIVPYKIPLADLPPVFPEQILREETVIEKRVVEKCVSVEKEEEKPEVEELPDKPKDADSEIIPNQNLTDDEIAQLILEEEELLNDQGVLGVNFKKPRPRIPVLRESKVLEELQHIAVEDPPRLQEIKHTSTFLQKPERPIPKQRGAADDESDVPPYRVVIKKQSKKTVTAKLLEKGLLAPGSLGTPEPPSETATPSATPEPTAASTRSDHETRCDSRQESEVVVDETLEVLSVVHGDVEEEISGETVVEDRRKDEEEVLKEKEEKEREEKEREEEQEAKTKEDSRELIISGIEREMADVAAKVDKEKIKELVTTEIGLEKQLENVQRQLLALKQLPSEIENHLKIVSEQLRVIMELSGVQNGVHQNGVQYGVQNGTQRNGGFVTSEETRDSSEEENLGKQRPNRKMDARRNEPDEWEEEEWVSYEEETDTSQSEGRPSTAMSREPPRIIEPTEEEVETETKELDGTITVKSVEEDGSRVKKFVVSYETKVFKSRETSPALSQGSFEPDPNLSPKDQVIQELQVLEKPRKNHRKGRKHSKDLWPQAKQLELTLGRRWRCPNDFFNDEMIAEVLSSQAEVIRGRALGVNFKKYEKTNLPNYDHLMNSSVYKMIHKMEREPKKGIPARPPKVNAAEDILERVRSPMSTADDSSTRSISH